jgi:hypothetical protein
MQLTGLAPLGAVSHRFNFFINAVNTNEIKIQTLNINYKTSTFK